MKKDEFKKELYTYIKNFIVLLLVSIPLSLSFSLTKLIFKIENEKVIWFIDLGIYNFIALLLVSYINYKIQSKRTNLVIKCYYSKEKFKKIILNCTENKSIFLEISIEGFIEKIPEKITLKFPDWVDAQTKRKNYLTIFDNENKYEVNLRELFNDTGKITQKRTIQFDLIGNETLNQSALIDPKISENKNRIMTSVKKEALDIELKGE